MSAFDGISRKLGNELHTKFFTQNGTAKSEGAKEAKPTVPIGKPETKEIGRDLLNDNLYSAVGFVGKTGAIAQEDKKDLNKLYALLDVKVAAPTAEQYQSIANATQAFSGGMDKLTASNNAETFFSSKQMQLINEEFGIA